MEEEGKKNNRNKTGQERGKGKEMRREGWQAGGGETAGESKDAIAPLVLFAIFKEFY